MPIIVDNISEKEIYVSEEEINYINYHDYTLEQFVGHECIKAIRERANFDEIIEFANLVRKAGGGNIINDLMPSSPEQPNSCLLANALNFDCCVNGGGEMWYMEVDEEDLAIKISEAIGTEYTDDIGYSDGRIIYKITLPVNIGYVAAAFDTYRDVELDSYNAEGSEF